LKQASDPPFTGGSRKAARAFAGGGPSQRGKNRSGPPRRIVCFLSHSVARPAEQTGAGGRGTRPPTGRWLPVSKGCPHKGNISHWPELGGRRDRHHPRLAWNPGKTGARRLCAGPGYGPGIWRSHQRARRKKPSFSHAQCRAMPQGQLWLPPDRGTDRGVQGWQRLAATGFRGRAGWDGIGICGPCHERSPLRRVTMVPGRGGISGGDVARPSLSSDRNLRPATPQTTVKLHPWQREIPRAAFVSFRKGQGLRGGTPLGGNFLMPERLARLKLCPP